MNVWKIRTSLLFPLLACGVVFVSFANARADLSPQQARRALTRIPGFEIKRGGVRVKSVSGSSAAAAQVSAEIRAVFKFTMDQQGSWRVAEVRSSRDRWEEIDLLASAIGTNVTTGECNAPGPPASGQLTTDPSVKRARCLLANLFGVETPSDSLRIQEIEALPIPLASRPSATVVAWVRVDARLLADKGGWRVTELRTGKRGWVELDPLVAAINDAKQSRARAELALIAAALEKFRKERGFYVIAASEAAAVDHLSPRYLAQVIRVDPWHQPYQYRGDRDHFTLRSNGPDGKENTPDDIELTGRN